ncbi:MAG: YeeE/YedE family protein [bacterium]
MVFENFAVAQSFFLWAIFIVAFIMGLVANKTNFCTMGAISDWVNMGDLGRFRAWLLAILIAMLGVVLFEYFGLVQVDQSFPPYRAGQLIWAENLIGGILFGIGMTLASGCGNKTLLRFGTGNLKSLIVILVIGVVAYFMVNPLPNTDETLFTFLFYPWLRPLALDLGSSQDLGTLIAGEEQAVLMRLVIGVLLGAALAFFIFKSAAFLRSMDNILAGIVIGLAVLAAWYITSNVAVDLDGEAQSLRDYAQNWDFNATEADGVQPADTRPLSPQSFTFINPMAQTLGYSASGLNSALLTFGVVAFLGVVLGSFVWALMSRSFRIEWFANGKDFVSHLLGAVLMGVGGVLAMGCTVGQAITGVSTLALGSFIAFFGIVLGSALTMKVQLYKMVYEDEATFFKALVTGLADLKLVPNRLRAFDKV